MHALGAAKAAALQGFHAFSDVTGQFAGKRKLNCWKSLSRCSEEVVSALGTSEELGAKTERDIEALVCQLYASGTTVVDVVDLRWKLFTKKQLPRSCHLLYTRS